MASRPPFWAAAGPQDCISATGSPRRLARQTRRSSPASREIGRRSKWHSQAANRGVILFFQQRRRRVLRRRPRRRRPRRRQSTERQHTMAGRPDPRSQEGYPSSSPSSSDPHDPFSNSQGEHVYYDNESDHVEYRRRDRDTYASDSSNHGYNDDGYYDNNGGYDPYGGEPIPSQRPASHELTSSQLDSLIQTRKSTSTVTSMLLRRNRSGPRAWASQNRQHPRFSTEVLQAHARRIQRGAQSVKFPCRRKR